MQFSYALRTEEIDNNQLLSLRRKDVLKFIGASSRPAALRIDQCHDFVVYDKSDSDPNKEARLEFDGYIMPHVEADVIPPREVVGQDNLARQASLSVPNSNRVMHVLPKIKVILNTYYHPMK